MAGEVTSLPGFSHESQSKEWEGMASDMRKNAQPLCDSDPAEPAGVAAAPGPVHRKPLPAQRTSLRATPAPEEFGVDTLDPGSGSALCGQSPAWQQRAQRNQVWRHSTEQ